VTIGKWGFLVGVILALTVINKVTAAELNLSLGLHSNIMGEYFHVDDAIVVGEVDVWGTIEVTVDHRFNSRWASRCGYTHLSDPTTTKDNGIDMLGCRVVYTIFRK
jgi:hypothetical protein